MTQRGPAVRIALSGHRHELPGVAVCVQGELQDAERLISHLAVGRDTAESPAAQSPRADNEFADPKGGIERTSRRLGREPLVVARVRVEHQLGAGGVEIGPEGQGRGAFGRGAGVERGQMPVGERALLGVCGKVRFEPLLLRRPGGHRDLGVQRDDVPVAEVGAVVAARGVVGRGRELPQLSREVSQVARGPGGGVIEVAGDGVGPRQLASPVRIVAAGVIGRRSGGSGGVAGHDDVPRQGIEERGGRGAVCVGAGRDIPGHEEHRLGRPGEREGRCGREGLTILATRGQEESGQD